LDPIYDPATKEQSSKWRNSGSTTFKEVQDTEVIKQGADICLLEQRWNFACRLAGKGCNHHGKVLCYISRKTGLYKRRGKLSKGILFHQDNAAPHNAAITHQKLADLHFEVLKTSGLLT
jgi:hypothetical protein